MGPAALAQVLRPLTTTFRAEEHPDLLVGLQVADDAAVYRLNEAQAIVQTLDFFAPVLDDSYLVGAVAAGSTPVRRRTTPRPTRSMLGVSPFVLTATIVLGVCIPARCWIAPEMPVAMYSCGETVLPVWPTWDACGYQPASTAARDAPTAAPRASTGRDRSATT